MNDLGQGVTKFTDDTQLGCATEMQNRRKENNNSNNYVRDTSAMRENPPKT